MIPAEALSTVFAVLGVLAFSFVIALALGCLIDEIKGRTSTTGALAFLCGFPALTVSGIALVT